MAFMNTYRNLGHIRSVLIHQMYNSNSEGLNFPPDNSTTGTWLKAHSVTGSSYLVAPSRLSFLPLLASPFEEGRATAMGVGINFRKPRGRTSDIRSRYLLVGRRYSAPQSRKGSQTLRVWPKEKGQTPPALSPNLKLVHEVRSKRLTKKGSAIDGCSPTVKQFLIATTWISLVFILASYVLCPVHAILLIFTA